MSWQMIYKGRSMQPTFRPGDCLEITGNRCAWRRGDVAVFCSPVDGEKVVHRVISTANGCLQTRGDHNLRRDPYTLLGNEVIGRVVCRQHRGRNRPVLQGWPGYGYALVWRTGLQLKKMARYLLKPVYLRAAAGVRPLQKSRVLQKHITMLSFRAPQGLEYQLLFGKRPIGQKTAGADHWRIRFPFRLIVAEQLLDERLAIMARRHRAGAQAENA